MASLGRNSTLTNSNADAKEFTPPWHPDKTLLIGAKMRPMVVVVCSQESYTAMPIFSFHRRGLEGKRNAEEYVPIREEFCGEDPRYHEKASPHAPAIIRNNAKTRFGEMKSSISLVNPITRRYIDEVEVWGEMTPPSFARVRLYHIKHALGMPLDSPLQLDNVLGITRKTVEAVTEGVKTMKIEDKTSDTPNTVPTIKVAA